MNICNKCGAKLENNIAFCPLCGAYNDRENRHTPPVAYMRNDFTFGYKRKILKLLDAIILTAALFCSVIALFNVISGISLKNWWYVYVMLGLICVKFGVIDMLKKAKYNWRCILADCVIGILAVVLIDFYTLDFNGFSLSYVIPAMIAAASVIVTVFTLNGMLNPLSAVQAFAILLISGGAIITLNALLKFFTVLNLAVYTVVIAETVAALCFLLLFLFKYKDFTKAFLESFKTR